MIVKELIQSLESNAQAAVQIALPTGKLVPAHFHVTEVGRIDKKFIDCGGTRRESASCLLQIWTANDFDHRLTAGKLSQILMLAQPLLSSDQLPVEVEYGADVASQYVVASLEVTPQGLLFVLAGKQTDCLAKDQCGVESCCSSECC